MNDYLNALWGNNAVSRTLVVLIFCLLISSLYFAFVNIRRYLGYETRMLKRVMGRLRRWKDAQGAAQIADEDNSADKSDQAEDEPGLPRQSLIDIHELKEGIPRQSIIGDRLETITKARAAHVKVSPDVLQQMSLAKETTKVGLGIPGFAVGFAMLLGLLGTVYGLTLMVQHIDALILPDARDVTQESWTDTLKGIKDILFGMKTAFSTTLVGLICSIISAGLNFFLGSAQANYFKELDRFTIEELLPAVVPSVEDETLLQEVSRQLEASFNSLDDITAKNTTIIKDLNAAEKAFMLIVANIQKITQDDKTEDIKTLTGELSVVVGELTKVNQSVINVATHMPKVVEVIQQSNQGLMKQFDEIIRVNQQQQRQPPSPASFAGGPRIAGRSQQNYLDSALADQSQDSSYRRMDSESGHLMHLLTGNNYVPALTIIFLIFLVFYLLWH